MSPRKADSERADSNTRRRSESADSATGGEPDRKAETRRESATRGGSAGESTPSDSATADSSGRAARLQQAWGNRAVAQAAAAARDRSPDSRSRTAADRNSSRPTESSAQPKGGSTAAASGPKAVEADRKTPDSETPPAAGDQPKVEDVRTKPDTTEPAQTKKPPESTATQGERSESPGAEAADPAAKQPGRAPPGQRSPAEPTGPGPAATKEEAEQTQAADTESRSAAGGTDASASPSGEGDAGAAEASAPPSPGDGPWLHPAPGSRLIKQLKAMAVQPKLSVGSPNDRHEREADAVASAASGGRSAPSISPDIDGSAGGVVRQQRKDTSGAPGARATSVRTSGSTPTRSRGSGGNLDIHTPVAETIENPGTGRPLPGGVRRSIEPHLGAPLDGVQVHDDGAAAHAAGSLGSRALTHGNHIFLGGGETAHDVELMAHEATHVVQQGATGDGSQTTATGSPTAKVQRFVPDIALEKLNDYANNIPGWKLFTVIIGYNPLTGKSVDRTPTNLVEGLIGLIPFGAKIIEKLREFTLLQKAFTWIKSQLVNLDLTLKRVKDTIEAAWEEARLLKGVDYNLRVLEKHFGKLKDDVEEFALTLKDKILSMIKEAAVSLAERLLADNKAWALIKKILGRDPLREEKVEATRTEILADFLKLIGKEQHLQQMRKQGVVQQAADWIATKFKQFMGLLSTFKELIATAWETLQPQNLPNLRANLESLARQVGTFLQRVWDFATDVADKVLELVKDALLGKLSSFASDNLPGFFLLKVVIGRNPFTGEQVPRTPQNLMRGFITLLPGGNAIYQRLAQAGVIQQAGARIQEAVTQLGISWKLIKGIFTTIWDSLSIESLVEPIATFTRIVNKLRAPVSRLIAFLRVVIRELVHVALQVMNFPSQLIGSIISNVMQAYTAIKNDPIGFLKNMLGALKLGFQNFFSNILTHLVGGVTDWLFRGVREAGIQPPADFSLSSVLDFVLKVVGITKERIWEKLAARIGDEKVERIRGAIDKLTGIWTFVQDVQERGVVAIWEYISSKITGLWDMIIGKAKDWIMERVVTRASQWLLSLLDPSGITAVVNSFVAFFKAVQSAVEYFRDILSIINDYVSTLAAVAQGQLAAGASKLEQALANAIPVAIGFLANQFGLGNIGQKVKEIVTSIRGVVDRAIDWLLDKAEAAIDSIKGVLGLGGQEKAEGPSAATGDSQKAQRVRAGLAAIDEAEKRYVKGGRIGREDAVEVTKTVKRKHSVFTRLEVVEGEGTWDYVFEASPAETKEGPKKKTQEGDLPFEVGETVKIVRRSGEGWVAVLEAVTSRGVQFKVKTGPQAGKTLYYSKQEVINKRGFEEHEGHASKYVLVNELKPEYQTEKRKRFYPSHWIKDVKDWAKKRLEALKDDRHPDKYREEIDGELAPVSDVQKDHIESVGQHWNSGAAGHKAGRKTTQSARREFYFDTDNLQLTTAKKNQEKGGEEMEDEVGPGFRGPNE